MTTKFDITTGGGSKYLVDGVILNTAAAVNSWKEEKRWDGRNMVSVATGSQWVHETLYLSRKSRYWIERTSQWEGAQSHAEFVDNEAAFRWLRLNEWEIPADLTSCADSCEE